MKVSIMKALIAAGATPDMLIAAAEAEEAEEMARIAERRAKDAERKRRSRATSAMSRGVRVTECDNADPFPKQRKVSPCTPSKETQPLPITPSPPSEVRPPLDRATRLPEDWTPSEADEDYAIGELGAEGARREAEKFRNYWLSKGGKDARKTSWSRTWRNWVISAKERAHGRFDNRNTGQRASGAPRPDPVVSAMVAMCNRGPRSPTAEPPFDPFSPRPDGGTAGDGWPDDRTIDLAPVAGGRSGNHAGGGGGPSLFAIQGGGRWGGSR